MSDAFVGEIRAFAFNVVPKGWAPCNGQLLPISGNTALFSLLGTSFGGDGSTTFGLPDLQGSVPLDVGDGTNGLSPRVLGEAGGTENLLLLATEIPVHSHGLKADALDPSDLNAPAPTRCLAQSTGVAGFQTSPNNVVPMAVQALGAAGGDVPHSNMQPYLTLTFCIALQGIFPQRS
jgi:microcystin-dependent protein